jgi:hypothetical protein
MGVEVGGILGLIILILDIYAVMKVFGSGASTGVKILWTLLIVFLPIIGLVAWFFVGPKS